jgi:beta-N-acetylhexosaminidase
MLTRFALALSLVAGLALASPSSQAHNHNDENEDKLLGDMDYIDPDLALARSLIATWWNNWGPEYGAYVLFERNFQDDEDIACQIRSEWPRALVLVDQEGGSVVRMRNPPEIIPIPPPQAPAVGEATYRTYSQNVAKLMKQSCVDVNLAPVLEPSHRGQWQRSAGIDPETVVTYARAYAEAMIAAGIIPTYKHFPGQTGRASRALGNPWVNPERGREPLVVTETRPGEIREWAKRFLPPEPGWVMISNNFYPALAQGREALPAVMDPAVKDLLVETGFKGVVITDALAELRTLTPQMVMAMLPAADMFMLLQRDEVAVFEETVVQGLRQGWIRREDLARKRDRIEQSRVWVRGGPVAGSRPPPSQPKR